jgi:hypothetical protein
MGPLGSTVTRLYGTKGWLALGAFALVLLVVVPLLNLAVPETSAFHVSTYWVTLIGKIMCYAIVALAVDLIWGYCGILSLGHGLFFALGGYAMGMYLMRQIGREGQYQSDLPDFMVFLDWKEFPWQWWGTDSFLWSAFLVVAVPGLLAYVFGYFGQREQQGRRGPAHPLQRAGLLQAFRGEQNPVLIRVFGLQVKAHPEAGQPLPRAGEAGFGAKLPAHVADDEPHDAFVGQGLQTVGRFGRIDADPFQGGQIDEQFLAAAGLGIQQRGAGEVHHAHHHLREAPGARNLFEVAEYLRPRRQRQHHQ